MRKCKINLLIVFGLTIAIKGYSQELSYVQYTTEDGLPSMKIYDLMQDSVGMIWMGTENGLVSFDGDEFTTYTHPDLKDNDIIEAIIGPNGRIFFSNINEQVGYVENGNMVLIEVEIQVFKTLEFNVFNQKMYLTTQTDNGKKIFELSEREHGEFDLFPTDIYFFNDDKHITFTKLDDYRFMCREDSTIVYAATKFTKTLVSKHENYLFSSTLKDQLFLVDDFINEYYNNISREGCLKFGNDIFIKRSLGFEYYNPATGKIKSFFNDFRINTIFIDAENNAWVSTPNDGLFKVLNLFSNNSKSDDILEVSEGVFDIIQLDDGTIILGSNAGDAIIMNGGKVRFEKVSKDKRPVRLYEHRDFVYAYNNYTIAYIDKRSLEFKLNTKSVLNNRSVLVKGTNMYVGSRSGIFIEPLDKFFAHQRFAIYPQIPGNRVLELFQDEVSKKIYAGTSNGLYTIDHDTIIPVDLPLLNSEVISDITTGEDNSFWVGTNSGIAVNIRGDSIIQQFQMGNELVKYRINDIEIYEDELLVSTNYGLIITDLRTGDTKTLNEYNYLPSNEVFVCKVIDDRYWVGSKDDLTKLNKDEIKDLNTTGPNLTLKDVLVNGINVDHRKELKFKHNENNIQLNFRNISYKSGKDKALKYRIPLIDTNWITTLDPSIRLPALQPGSYDIEVYGINSFGQQSDLLKVEFDVAIPWWKEWWVITLAMISLVSLVYGIIMIRSRRVRKEEAVKRDYLTQINRIKDQALQLQMNPHFIFNSLNAIQGFIGTDEEEKAMNYLARFARLIRLIFEHSKGNSISLDDEIEFMQLYIDLETLRFKDKVEVQLNVDPALDEMRDIIKVPPLLIQPIVENSFKHGLFHKKGKGHLKIDYLLDEENVLKVVVQDDGIGRKKAATISKPNDDKHISSGIKTTDERINLLNFDEKEYQNQMIITDMYDEEGMAIGTKTTLYLSV